MSITKLSFIVDMFDAQLERFSTDGFSSTGPLPILSTGTGPIRRNEAPGSRSIYNYTHILVMDGAELAITTDLTRCRY